MTENPDFLKILWGNIVGDTREQIESFSWKGVAQFLVDQTGQVAITSLVPAGVILTPLYEFFVGTMSRALDKTFKDYGELEVHILDSGVAVLESAQPLSRILDDGLKRPMEISLDAFLQPRDNLRLQPDASLGRGHAGWEYRRGTRFAVRKVSRQVSLGQQRQLRLVSGSQRQRWQKRDMSDLLNERRQGNALVSRRTRAGRTPPQSTIRRDVLYPTWALTGVADSANSNSLISVSSFQERLKKIAEQNEKKRQERKNLSAKAQAVKNLQAQQQRSIDHSMDAIKRSQEQADRARKLRQQQNMHKRRR